MENTQPAKRETYAELLRILAAFVVVFQHTVTSVWYDTPVDSADFFALNFMNSLTRFGVGVFIMISGAFMLSPKYAHPPRKVLIHNFARIVVLIIFWVLFYGVVNGVCEAVEKDLGVGEFVLNLLSAPVLLFTKPATHLWFLYVIAGLYLITPAMRVFTAHASKNMMLYLMGIFFAFGLVLPTLSQLLAKWFDFTLYKNIGIRGSMTFAGFYLSGFYISHYGLGPLARRLLYVSAMASWAVAFFLSTYISLLRDVPNEFFFGNFRPTTFLMAAGVFCFFRHRYGSATTQNFWPIALSKCMLGVYVLHPVFIRIFYGLHLSLLEPHPLLTAPLMAVLFFCLSTAVVFLFRKIPGFSKFL